MTDYFTKAIITCMAILLGVVIIMFLLSSPEPVRFGKDSFIEEEKAYIRGIVYEIRGIINELKSVYPGNETVNELNTVNDKLLLLINNNGLSVEQYNETIEGLLMKSDSNRVKDEYLASEIRLIKSYLKNLIIKWDPDPVIIEKGRMVYWRNCVMCHGIDGKGIALREFDDTSVAPRNFHGDGETKKKVVFKYVGKGDRLPTDQELVSLLERGIPGTPMKSFSALGKRQLGYVIEYIKTFDYIQWRYNSPADTGQITPEPPLELLSESYIVNGRKLYQGLCMNCHGNFEASDADYNRNNLSGRDFLNKPLKRGGEPVDLFNTIKYGIPSVDGIGMPSNPQLSRKELWQVVSYVLYLLNRNRTHSK